MDLKSGYGNLTFPSVFPKMKNKKPNTSGSIKHATIILVFCHQIVERLWVRMRKMYLQPEIYVLCLFVVLLLKTLHSKQL